MFFFFLPWGIEHARVRLPVVSIGIFVACLLAFVATWLVPKEPLGVGDHELEAVLHRFERHPYLVFNDEFSKTFLTSEGQARIAERRAEWASTHTAPDEEARGAEQQAFDMLQQSLVEKRDTSGFYRSALVPARGAHRGWLTHMFLHFGWGHLLFNMLFLYIVGPMLEDLLGRLRFLGFYLLGGLLAAGCHVLFNVGSTQPMVGASGAIAACMGAFAVRFATKRISFFYLVLILVKPYVGFKSVPAWLAGAAWFLSEVRSFASGNHEGVAVLAHLGGFAFGAAVAFGMKAMGWEKNFASLSEQSVGPLEASVQHDVALGREHLAQQRWPEARAAFERAVAADATDVDAAHELTKRDFADGLTAHAHQRLVRTLELLVAENRHEQAAKQLLEVWHLVDPAVLPTALALKLARISEEATPHLAELMYLRASDEAGLRGDKALVRAAELRLQQFDEPWRAREYLQRRPLSPELQARAQQLLAQAPEPPSAKPVSGLELDDTPRGGPVPPKVMACVLTDVTEHGLVIASQAGGTQLLVYAELVGVAAAMVPIERQGQQRGLLLVDLIVDLTPGSPAVVLRLDSDRSSQVVAKHFSASTPQQVYGQFVSHLFARSNARGYPDSESLSAGNFPRYQGAAALELAIYGAAQLSPAASLAG